MKVKIWGSRGSLPVALNARAVRAKILQALEFASNSGSDLSTTETRQHFVDHTLPFSIKNTFGGCTPCVQIEGGTEHVICDAGSGMHELGNEIVQKNGAPSHFHIFISHLHYDHIQGFPFFAPAYHPENILHFYGCHEILEGAIHGQQSIPYFPVPLHSMTAQRTFTILKPDQEYEIAGFCVRPIEQDHPGASYGFRFEKEDKTIVYSSDCEHRPAKVANGKYPFIDFYREADLLILDAQFHFQEALISKENWGHSNNITCVELAARANVKHLCLFHHDPNANDLMLDRLCRNSIEYLRHYRSSNALKISMAYDGVEIEV